MSGRHEYNADIFEADTLPDLMRVILTDEDIPSQERWIRETPYLAGLMIDKLDITANSTILDYGCGVGRLAKELISRTGCRIVGVDTSVSARAFAAHYVRSERFVAAHPGALDLFPRFDGCICVWVLQHVYDLNGCISQIAHALEPNAALLAVNNIGRVLPFRCGSMRGWADDKFDVFATVGEVMKEAEQGALDVAHVGNDVAEFAKWSVYRK